MSGCMTARRCAKVLAGGFQAVPGRHVVRGGQSLQMALLVPFLNKSGAPSCILNCGSCGLVLAVSVCCLIVLQGGVCAAMCLSSADTKAIATMPLEGCRFCCFSIIMHHDNAILC